MKVREISGNSPNIAGIPVREERKVQDTKDASFQNQLKYAEDRNFEERISELVNQITEQGEKLAKKIDVGELTVYKKMISEFLNEAVSSSHKFSKKNFLDRRGRHRSYAVIKKINEELDLLTNDVLNSEKDNIGILKRLDDIRGLIMDLTL